MHIESTNNFFFGQRACKTEKKIILYLHSVLKYQHFCDEFPYCNFIKLLTFKLVCVAYFVYKY